MNGKICGNLLICHDYAILKSSYSRKACAIFAHICELLIQKGSINAATTRPNHDGTTLEKSASNNCRKHPSAPNHIQLHPQLEDIAFTGYPVVIEYLLLPQLDLCFSYLMSDTAHVPAHQLEQWVVQFEHKRMVIDSVIFYDEIWSNIKSLCELSVVHDLIRGCDNSITVSDSRFFRFKYRLTKLWMDGNFSSSLLNFTTSDLTDKVEEFPSLGHNLKLICDLSNNFNKSIGSNVDNRPSNPMTTHPIIINGSFIGLSRFFVSELATLDITATSAKELPSDSPTGLDLENFIHTDKSANRGAKLGLLKSPPLLMFPWASRPTSFLDSLSLLTMQSKAPQVGDCTAQLMGLKVQRFRDHFNSMSESDGRNKNAKSLTKSISHHYSSTTTCSTFQSSPTPAKRKKSKRFQFNESIARLPSDRASMHGSAKTAHPSGLPFKYHLSRRGRSISASDSLDSAFCAGKIAPGTPLPVSSSHHLLINFEESMLNGRIPPSGMVEGFTLDVGASGSFFPAHVRLPVVAQFFQLTDDGNTPSPYLGRVDLSGLSNGRGYHVPHKGSIQLTLFNPSSSVMKVFVIQYNLEDMPANSQTFLRQRTIYVPVSGDEDGETSKIPSDLITCVFNGSVGSLKPPVGSLDAAPLPVYLRYLVHLRFQTTKSGNLYLHTDIRLIFARDNFEFDPRVATYRMKAILDTPSNPRFSTKATI